MPKRSGRKSLAQTPAPKSERIYGSSKNVKESATAQKAKNIVLSEKTTDVLKDKLKDFKKENPRKKNIDLNDLKAVYRRGSGAYSSSHRPTITGGAPNSRAAWSYARVNKFLKKASGEKVKAAYVQDDDLMAKGGLILDEAYSGKDVKKYLEEANYQDDLFFQYIKNSDKYVLKNVNINSIVQRDSGLHTHINQSIDEVSPNENEWEWANKFPIVIGDNEYDKNIVLDGYHRITQAIVNGEDEILSFVKREKYEDGGETTNKNQVESLIEKGIVDLKFYETTPEHAKEYGIESNKPLYVQNLIVLEKEKVLDYLEKYASENGNDVIFGYLADKSSFSKDSKQSFYSDIDTIKNWLHNNGYAINNETNEFHKFVKTNIKYEEGGLIAPNGKPSNLTAEQYELVRTPEFKVFFGDWENDPENASKVVDENGEPLVLHRGNLVNQEELGYTFNLGHDFLKKKSPNTFGFFFTNSIDIARKYMLVDHFDEIKGGSITDVFIKSNKILDLKDFDLKIGQTNFVEGLIQKGIIFDNELKKRILDFDSDTYKYWGYNIFDYFDVFPELKNLFIKNGFSSVVFYEMSRNYSKYQVYVAFNSNQIKLADGSNTTFDANNPDIRYEDGGLIAPNGRKSFLTPEQYKLVRTPEFKAWFGDWENDPENASKVVDENGEPKIMYHSSNNEFTIFDPKHQSRWITHRKENAIWFGGSKKVSTYTEIDGYLYEVFLRSINPIIVDAKNYDSWNYYYDENDNKTYDISRIKGRFITQAKEIKWDGTRNNNDGVIFYNAWDNVPLGMVVVVFDPTQIKLADGSNTTFDANNPDIRYEDGGETKSTKSMKKGDCYVVAAEFAMLGNPNKIDFIGQPFIVHAEVKGQGKIEGIRYGHAWVEDDVNVYDYSNGRQIVLPKQIYYMIGDVNTYEKTKYQRYTFSEARAKMLQTGTYGSWDIVTDFAEGGDVSDSQDITCVNCGWNWNTTDSDTSDKYICHKCGFDNTLFYGNQLLELSLEEMAEKNEIEVILLKSELICSKDYNNIYYKKGGYILKKAMTLEQIADKHGVGVDEIEKELKDGMKHELEHTDYKKVAETIALHHIAERPDYYEKLDEMEKMEEGGDVEVEVVETEPEREIVEFIKSEKKEARDVLTCGDTRIFKSMICKAKMENAVKRGKETENSEEKNVWHEVENIWRSCMNDILNNKMPEFKKGGSTEDCGCGKLYSKGGLAYGNSHDKGGMPMQVKSTGQNIEIEGGEAVVNKRSMQMSEKIEFEGERMTPCEVISKINEMGGGVKLKCEDVKEIIAEDGNF